MELIYILLAVIALLLIATVMRLPKSFDDNDGKRKLFRKKMRQQEKDSIFKA